MDDPNKKYIVILGGGTGGSIVANILAKKTSKLADITIVSNKDSFLYEPDFLFRLFDNRSIAPQYKLLRKAIDKGVKIHQGEVIGIDPLHNVVNLNDDQDLSYDYLDVATGANFDYTCLPDYEEVAHHFYTEEGTNKLRSAMKDFQGGKTVIGSYDIRHKCPIGPIEFTLMVNEL